MAKVDQDDASASDRSTDATVPVVGLGITPEVPDARVREPTGPHAAVSLTGVALLVEDDALVRASIRADQAALARHVLDVLAAEVDEQPANAPTPSASGGAIMLVDDDDDGRAMLSLLLELEGMHVLSAEDAETALQQAAAYSGSIALLITDVGLPGLTGDELARRLRALRPELEVLFVSGFPPTDEMRREGGFMLKPVELDELVWHARRLAMASHAGHPAGMPRSRASLRIR